MLEMPIRTGRRMQDAARQIREKYSRRTNERQQVNSLHRQRMTCSDSMRSFTNTQDWMNGMSISPAAGFASYAVNARKIEKIKFIISTINDTAGISSAKKNKHHKTSNIPFMIYIPLFFPIVSISTSAQEIVSKRYKMPHAMPNTMGGGSSGLLISDRYHSESGSVKSADNPPEIPVMSIE